MRNILIAICCIMTLSIAAGPLADIDRAKITAHLGNSSDRPWTWVFYGDSITQGAAHTHGWRSFQEIFAERLRHELKRPMDRVVNSGNSGQTTRELLSEKQYDWQVRSLKPDVVILMVGMNDIVSGRTPDAFRENLGVLVDRVRGDGAIVVLQTSNTIQKVENPNTDYLKKYLIRYEQLPQYMEIVREVAAKKDTLLVDNFAHWSNQAASPEVLASWLGETIHPGPRGHQEIAIQLLKTLDMYSPQSRCCTLAAGGVKAGTAPVDFQRFKEAVWNIEYSAADGLPGTGWKSDYPAGCLTLADGRLRLDNTSEGRHEYPLISLLDNASLKGVKSPVLAELKLCFVEPQKTIEGKPYRFFWTLSVESEGRIAEVIMQIAPGQTSGTLGNIRLPDTGDREFTLSFAIDVAAGVANVWCDGSPLGRFPIKNLSDKPVRLNFGDGSKTVGGIVELRSLKISTGSR